MRSCYDFPHLSRARPTTDPDGPGPLPTRVPIRVLLILAVLEIVLNRVGLPALAPTDGHEPPAWYAALDYGGLFLSYFTGTLAVAILGARAVATLLAGRGVRDLVAQVAMLGAVALFALEVALDAPAWVAIPAEALFGLAVLATVANAFGRGRDLGAQVGIGLLSLPLLLHTGGAFGVHFAWEDALSAPARTLASFGVMALALAALVSPYCFAPRPFTRSVGRPLPIVVAMGFAASGALAARAMYHRLVPLVQDAIGVQLATDRPDRSLAIYLLAIATLAWTLVSCALAPSRARRQIGAGLALLVLGGNAYRWPIHFLLPLVGLAIIAEATRHVREEELADIPIVNVTPPIADPTWGAYITAVATTLETSLTGIHTLTTRGEGGLVSTVIVAERSGLPVRVRIERFECAVLALDVVIGREIDELRGATFTLWAIPPRALGINPSGPPAAPLCKTGDAELDARFRFRGNVQAFHKLFDDALRGRAAAMLAGWLAHWDGDGLRYRVYPGRGSPLDLPIPLSDLALGRAAPPERLAGLVTMLAEAGARGIAPTIAAPSALAEPDAEPEPEAADAADAADSGKHAS